MRATIGTQVPSNKRYLVCAVSLALGGLYNPVAYAQNSSSFELEEVVVTARKRAESLQDVPATVNAFSEQAIEDAGIEGMSDYVGLVSNVSLIETQNSAFTFVNIRGNSQVRNSEPSVAIAIDGVLSTSPLSFSQEMFDVQQIEVLKGPQGALYGRNAVGGAINITTRQPTNETEGMVRLGYSNGNSWKTQAGVSGAIIEDELLYRVAGSYKDSDGLRENDFTGREIDPYHAEAIQAKLLWMPSDNFSVDARFSFSDNEGSAHQFAVVSPLWQAGFTGSPFPPHLQASGGDVIFAIPGNAIVSDPNNTSTEVQGNILGVDDRETYNASLKFDWQTDYGTITATSAWDMVDHFQGGEQFPYTSAAVQKATQYRNSESFSQEIKITSPEDQALRWIAGVYYVQTEFFVSYNLQTDGDGRNVTSVTTHPIRTGPNPTVPFGYNADFNDNTAYALFAQLNYDLREDLEISFALRYDNDEREQTVKTPVDMIPSFLTATTGDKRTEEYDAVQPKLTIRYEPSDDWTIYASYAEGFRSGGFISSGLAARSAELIAQGVAGVPGGVTDSYEQEDSKGFELGFKSTLLDGRLKLSGAAYTTTVDNQPIFNFVPVLNNAQIIRTVDEVELKGFELEAVFAINENLRVWGSYGYIDTEITKFTAEPFNEGNNTAYTPDESINLGVQYHHPITLAGMEMETMVRADWSRTGETYFNPSNFAPRDNVDLLNLRFAVDVTDDLNVVLWAKNLTDEEYVAEAVNPPGVAYYAAPRTYGLEMTKRF